MIYLYIFICKSRHDTVHTSHCRPHSLVALLQTHRGIRSENIGAVNLPETWRLTRIWSEHKQLNIFTQIKTLKMVQLHGDAQTYCSRVTQLIKTKLQVRPGRVFILQLWKKKRKRTVYSDTNRKLQTHQRGGHVGSSLNNSVKPAQLWDQWSEVNSRRSTHIWIFVMSCFSGTSCSRISSINLSQLH